MAGDIFLYGISNDCQITSNCSQKNHQKERAVPTSDWMSDNWYEQKMFFKICQLHEVWNDYYAGEHSQKFLRHLMS